MIDIHNTAGARNKMGVGAGGEGGGGMRGLEGVVVRGGWRGGGVERGEGRRRRNQRGCCQNSLILKSAGVGCSGVYFYQ